MFMAINILAALSMQNARHCRVLIFMAEGTLKMNFGAAIYSNRFIEAESQNIQIR